MSDATDRTARRIGRGAGTLLFLGAAVVEIVRIGTRRTPWPGFNAANDWVIGAVAVILWVASGYALAVAKRDLIVVMSFGVLALLTYGLLGTIGQSYFGIFYLAIGAAMPLLARLAFGGALALRSTTNAPPRARGGPRQIV